jgi:hypothetical protein
MKRFVRTDNGASACIPAGAWPCHATSWCWRRKEFDDLLPTAFALTFEPTFASVLAECMSQLALGSLQLHVWTRSGTLDSLKIDLHDDMRCGLFSSRTLAKFVVFAQLTLIMPTVIRSLVVASLQLPSDARASNLRNDCLARIYKRISKTIITTKERMHCRHPSSLWVISTTARVRRKR